ncbi:hypothetical protein D623_10030445 [Myotis brandtii]|uniref:Uncharacterized protein n=1 Tax=Myotis brandtii TaxID=109478 RepID=S7MNK0_MYOBR|nr:hypothetical protein D623_10030445 [Myotis brandtii]
MGKKQNKKKVEEVLEEEEEEYVSDGERRRDEGGGAAHSEADVGEVRRGPSSPGSLALRALGRPRQCYLDWVGGCRIALERRDVVEIGERDRPGSLNAWALTRLEGSQRREPRLRSVT